MDQDARVYFPIALAIGNVATFLLILRLCVTESPIEGPTFHNPVNATNLAIALMRECSD